MTSPIEDIEHRMEQRARPRDELRFGRSVHSSRLKYSRTGSTDRERAFARVWFGRMRRWSSVLRCLLAPITSEDPRSERRHYVTKREAEVAATVIQWLGTNVGFVFLEEALAASGYRIEQAETASGLRAQVATLRGERDAYEALLSKKATHLVRRGDGKRLYRGIDDTEIDTCGGAWVFGEDILRPQSVQHDAERALRETEDLCNARMRTIHRRAQAAESRAIKAERQLVHVTRERDAWALYGRGVWRQQQRDIATLHLLYEMRERAIPLEASSGVACGLDAAEARPTYSVIFEMPFRPPTEVSVSLPDPETGATPIEGKRYEICPLHRVVHFDATCDGPDATACATCGEDPCVSGCDLEDLARRRVTEQAERLSPMCEGRDNPAPPFYDLTDDERDLDAIATTLACSRDDVAEAVRLVATDYEAVKRERDEALDRTILTMALKRSAIARAERAEAVIAKVRERLTSAWVSCRDEVVLALLDGKEG